MNEKPIYLDHAATSYPKPACVLRAMERAVTYAGGNPGRAAHVLSLRASSCIYDARECAADFFGLDAPERVLFFPNATWALNTVLQSFGVTKNGVGHGMPQILISEAEHNAVVRPLHEMKLRGMATYGVFPVLRSPDAALTEEALLAHIRCRITQDTALVCVSHVSNVCGVRLPIAKIGALCRARHIPFCVDASQSAGIYDIDMVRDSIDYLCTAGHKGLLGPQGSGLLLIGENAPPLYSLVQGGNGVASLDPAMPRTLPESLEAGTLSTPAIAGLCAGMQYLRTVGLDGVREEARCVYRRLREILCNTPGVRVYGNDSDDGTVLSFSADGRRCGEVAAGLSDAGICCRSGYHCAPFIHRALGTVADGTVRVSVGHGNTRTDAERFARGLRGVLSE